MAMRTPFSMALGTLVKDQNKASSTEIEVVQAIEGISRPKVYLAGGFRSGWQDRVLSDISQFTFFDPRVHRLKNHQQYTLWDLEALRKSDLVFAYLEATNPGGYALALEVGFAKALGKRIILIDEKSVSGEQHRQHLSMLRAVADVSFETFEDGVNYLKMLERAV
jgi:hypothetical protein